MVVGGGGGGGGKGKESLPAWRDAIGTASSITICSKHGVKSGSLVTWMHGTKMKDTHTIPRARAHTHTHTHTKQRARLMDAPLEHPFHLMTTSQEIS